jgi:cutinase
VIFARGTNEPAGLGKVGDAFVDSLRQQTGLNILPYGVNYAASKLQLHGGDGANDTIDRVKKSVETCPNTKIVLGGYSQGAAVAGYTTTDTVPAGFGLPAHQGEHCAPER